MLSYPDHNRNGDLATSLYHLRREWLNETIGMMG